MKVFFKIFASILLLSSLFSCNKFNKVERSHDTQYKLEKADEYYASKKYHNAEILYQELFSAMKGTDKFEELCYKYAYCFYYEKQYQSAENQFKFYLELFPNSARAEEMDYMRAYCFFKQSPKVDLEQVNTVKAMTMMQSFINSHPGSPRIKDANAIIDEGREKLEQKETRAALLYYNLSQYRAAGIAYNNLLNNYPESQKGEHYKLMAVKSYYRFAKLSIADKQPERYERVTIEYLDFADRYPESKLLKEAEEYSNLSKHNLNEIRNEQTSPSAKL